MTETRQQSERMPAGHRPFSLRPIVTRILLFAVVWWILTGGRSDAWGLGAAFILFALLVSLRLMPAGPRHVSLWGLLIFAGFFIVRSVVAGTQVALIAMRPKLDLRPVIMELPTRLEDVSERVFLASALSLLPGTLSVGLEGRLLRLHVLDERMPVQEELQTMEELVARIFCGELA